MDNGALACCLRIVNTLHLDNGSALNRDCRIIGNKVILNSGIIREEVAGVIRAGPLFKIKGIFKYEVRRNRKSYFPQFIILLQIIKPIGIKCGIIAGNQFISSLFQAAVNDDGSRL